MKLEPITMDRNEARRAFIEYRNAVRAKHSDEDAEIMRGYRELAKGRQLIKLSETIAAGGLVDINATRGSYNKVAERVIRVACIDRLPRLAIARASAEWCHVRVNDERITFDENRWQSRSQLKHRSVPTIPGAVSYNSYRAMVPPVPPRFRPKASLDNFHVLWEAEWKRQAPVDPALLRHIGGDLYAVLAVWDLTPLEQSVLMHRFEN